MSLLITKHNKSGSTDGKHFNYFRRKSIHALIPQCKTPVPQCSKEHVTKREETEEIEESKENEEDSAPGNEFHLKNNYYSSLQSLRSDVAIEEGSALFEDENSDSDSDSELDTDDTDETNDTNTVRKKSVDSPNKGTDNVDVSNLDSVENSTIKTPVKSVKNWYENRRSELEKRKLLIPRQPVWRSKRCLRQDEWYTLYEKEIKDICDYTSNFFGYLADNGYNIRLEEDEMHSKLINHLYRTSENVQSTYMMNK